MDFLLEYIESYSLSDLKPPLYEVYRGEITWCACHMLWRT